jgi:polar amino acid transport system substrate-binding protein
MSRVRWYRWFACACALCALPPSFAACSRPMLLPLNPSGMTRVNGEEIGGFLPDILRKMGKQFGCEWQFTVAPRARVEALFEAGQADVLVGATRSQRRDQLGYFSPMMESRATVLSFGKPTPPVASLSDLEKRRDLRVALVRGQEYGPAFDALTKRLLAQKRLVYGADPVAVARMLDAGIVDVTIMAPIAFAGLLGTDPRYAPLIERIRIDPVDELPWSATGAYISKETVGAADRAVLEALFAELARNGWLLENMKHTYPPNVLRESVR